MGSGAGSKAASKGGAAKGGAKASKKKSKKTTTKTTKKKEKKIKMDVEQEDKPPPTNEELMEKGQKYQSLGTSRLVHFVFVWKLVTTVAAVNMIIVQCVGAGLTNNDSIEVIPVAARIYIIIFCLCVIMNEMGLGEKLTGGSALFSNWIVRALFYGYIGLTELEQDATDYSKWFGYYATGVAWYMIVVCGGMYLALGALCCQLRYNSIVPDLDQLQEDFDPTTRKRMKQLAIRGF